MQEGSNAGLSPILQLEPGFSQAKSRVQRSFPIRYRFCAAHVALATGISITIIIVVLLPHIQLLSGKRARFEV